MPGSLTESAIRPRSRSYGPAVLLGLGGATLAAVAGTRGWVTAHGDAAGIKVQTVVKGSDVAPLVTALALVALAAWGVVLVMRGRMRRVVALVGALASLGSVIAGIDAFDGAQNAAFAALADKGATGDVGTSTLTAWYYLAGLGAAAAVVAFLVAVVRVPGWPEMGRKYDAPGTRSEQPPTENDLWRALDEGHDPTT